MVDLFSHNLVISIPNYLNSVGNPKTSSKSLFGLYTVLAQPI